MYLVRFAGDDGQVLKEGVPLPTRVTVERIAPLVEHAVSHVLAESRGLLLAFRFELV